jgi:hypothetical protein
MGSGRSPQVPSRSRCSVEGRTATRGPLRGCGRMSVGACASTRELNVGSRALSFHSRGRVIRFARSPFTSRWTRHLDTGSTIAITSVTGGHRRFRQDLFGLCTLGGRPDTRRRTDHVYEADDMTDQDRSGSAPGRPCDAVARFTCRQAARQGVIGTSASAAALGSPAGTAVSNTSVCSI